MTYWNPFATRPASDMPFAWAFTLASVGLRIRKLQLLHPAGGVRDAPLSDASAGGGATTFEMTSDDANTIVATSARLYITLLEKNDQRTVLADLAVVTY
ncbi:hypothetical protein GCM10010532_039110 [Dactylosporangium siamense]|uniref:Uncharacterized protein n=1 Tax=Dactylosporangium siamense TaxID=685454 RepID=A0A919PWN0_9ACTN|nr:hypothetical protein Dsi01nite_077860 [Dactylosporangium siamense]